jgi:hypothetical protein
MSLPLLPEGVLCDFTWKACVQDILDCLPGSQNPKFLSQLRQHNANSQVMQTNVCLHDQQSREMVRPMEENGVYLFSSKIRKLEPAADA